MGGAREISCNLPHRSRSACRPSSPLRRSTHSPLSTCLQQFASQTSKRCMVCLPDSLVSPWPCFILFQYPPTYAFPSPIVYLPVENPKVKSFLSVQSNIPPLPHPCSSNILPLPHLALLTLRHFSIPQCVMGTVPLWLFMEGGRQFIYGRELHI